MIDPVTQDLREYEDRECAQAALDARIDAATTEALSTLSESEMLTALTEIDVDGRAKAGSPEDLFYDLLIFIRETANKELNSGSITTNKVGKALYGLVWKSHRRYEVEPGWTE